MAERERLRLERNQQLIHETLKKGLAGQRLGRHFVPEGDVDVQLGEDLTESLRALKVSTPSTRAFVAVKEAKQLMSAQPEGNLFKDRFLSMQQRALIEPRVPVLCVYKLYVCIILPLDLTRHRFI